MHHPRGLLSLIFSFFLLTLISSPITAITIPRPHSPPPLPPSALTPRALHTLRNDYTLRFTTSTAIMPIQIGATALSLWYTSIWRRINTRPSPSVPQVFKQAFAYHTKHLKLSFTPQLPASNLAMKSMAMAFVEWIEARARQGFCEMYEATMEGPWGTMGIKMEWIGP